MQLTTACTLDCPDTCSLHVDVVEGRLVGVTAAPGNPLTQGFICQKVSRHAERVYAPERVLTPLRRTGAKGSGQFEPITWDDAIGEIARRIRSAISTDGAGSVVPYLYSSSAGAVAKGVLAPRLWSDLGAAKVEHTICAATFSEAYAQVFGSMLSVDAFEITRSRFIVIWGANPTVSNTHLPPLIHQAQEAGARLAVIDPRRTGIAKRADLHLAVHPGTDVVLAYAVANRVVTNGSLANDFLAKHADGVERFVSAASEWPLDRAAEVTGIEASEIAALADEWAATRPALLRLGWGVERNRNGGSACRAVLSLPVLMGHFGEAGSGVLSDMGGRAPMALGRPDDDQRDSRRRRVNMNSLGQLLCDGDDNGSVSVLFVQGANPAVMNPNQAAVLRGLERDDLFTVVHDQVLTDTCRYADIVLPATTHFEADDYASSYGSYALQKVNKVIEPVGESRTNNEVSAALALALGLDRTEYEIDAFAFASSRIHERAVEVRSGATVVFEPPCSVRQFVTTLPNFDSTPEGPSARNGKAQLAVAGLGGYAVPQYRELPEDAGDYPLTLITPATHRLINSMFGEFNSPAFVVHVHPVDAADRGLTDGEPVRVFNRQGAVVLPVSFDPDQRPGVVMIPKGIWMRAAGGSTANVLVPDTLSDLADGACFNDARVQLAPALLVPG